MNVSFQNLVDRLIDEQGIGVLEHSNRCRVLLNSYANGNFRKEIRHFLHGLDLHCYPKLRSSAEPKTVKPQLLAELQDEYMLSPEEAAATLDIIETLAEEQKKTDDSVISSLTLAAQSGDYYAQYALGGLFERLRRYREAIFWLKEAAKHYETVLKDASPTQAAPTPAPTPPDHPHSTPAHGQAAHTSAHPPPNHAHTTPAHPHTTPNHAHTTPTHPHTTPAHGQPKPAHPHAAQAPAHPQTQEADTPAAQAQPAQAPAQPPQKDPRVEAAPVPPAPSAAPNEKNTPKGFVKITGDTFLIGSPEGEAERIENELSHEVTVLDFYMGVYAVTQQEYEASMEMNPSHFKGPKLPVESVSWYDAVAYCNARSTNEGLTPAYTMKGEIIRWAHSSNGYRLPTEAEWEYACRAGTRTPFNTGTVITTELANYDGTYPYGDCPRGIYREKTTPVGSFPPNTWGLYDMHGNVWEWCWDWFAQYDTRKTYNPTGPTLGTNRVIRGGSWGGGARYLRAAYRCGSSPFARDTYLGFRLVLPCPS